MNFEQIKQLAGIYNNAEIWDVKPGYEVEIHEKVKEGNNERIWKFRWLVIRVNKPNSHDGTFTVRGKVLGVDIEKTYPLCSQTIQEIILLDKKRIRRSKLYFIRNKVGKAAKLKSLLAGKKTSEKGKKLKKKRIVSVINNQLKENTNNQTEEEVTK